MKRARNALEIEPPSAKRRRAVKDIEHSILDNLAKLFEITSLGCTAVCFQNSKILISDNDINSNTNDTEKLRVIKEVMEYFHNYGNSQAKESLGEERKKIFKRIAVARVRGENAGYIGNLGDDIIESIAEDILKNKDSWRNDGYNEKIKSYPRSSRQFVALSYEILDNLARSFVKIENFIGKNVDHSLTKAFKATYRGKVDTGDYDEISYNSFSLMHDKENPGYVIISPGRKIDRDKAVHAEVKMIDYLVFTRVLQTANNPIYIGISKLCCADCANIIKECNVYKEKIIKTIQDETEVTEEEYKQIIQTQGAHNLKFACKAPIFLNDENSFDPIALDSLRSGNVGYYIYYDGEDPIDKGFQNIKDAEKLAKEGHEVFVYTDLGFWKKLQKQKGVQNLIKNLKSAKGGTEDRHVDQYYYSQSSSDDLSHEDLMQADLEGIEVEFQDRMEFKKNAFNQATNSSYMYQKKDLIAIGAKLINPKNFIGVVDKQNIKEELYKFQPLNQEKILGIYQASKDKWVSFCIQHTKSGVKAYYIDPVGDAPLKDFGIAVQEVFNTGSHNSTHYSPLVTEQDSGVLALLSLHAMNSNPKKSFEIVNNKDKYQIFINNLRQENADIFIQTVCGANSEEVKFAKAAWDIILRDHKLEKFKLYVEERPEESVLLQFIMNHEEEFISTKIPGSKGMTLFEVFVQEEDGRRKINPRTLAVVEELLTQESLENSKLQVPFSPIIFNDFTPIHSPKYIHEAPSITVSEADSTVNEAATRFLTPDDNNLTQLDYNSWYSSNNINDLNSPRSESGILNYVFIDDMDPVGAFTKQLDRLRILNNLITEDSKELNAISFVAKEPGAGQNHFIYGLLIKPYGGTAKLLMINPTGETKHTDFYAILAGFQKKIDMEIYVTTSKLQQDQEGLVSCGPICTELMQHISKLNPEILNINLNSYTQPDTTKEGCKFKLIEIPKLFFPSSFPFLLNANPEEYKQAITSLRKKHFENLKSLTPEEVKNREYKWTKFQDIMFKDNSEVSLDTLKVILTDHKAKQSTSSSKEVSDKVSSTTKPKEYDNANLKYAEKRGVFEKEVNLQDYLWQNLNVKQKAVLTKLKLYADIDDQNDNESIKRFKTSDAGSVTLLPEVDHLKDHQVNIEKIIGLIREGKIDSSTIIYLERKEEGHNLGMGDVRLLANIIKYNEVNNEKIPINEKIKQSPIYQDAILLKVAKKYNIGVKGIDLAGSKSSGVTDQNKNRETYMIDKMKNTIKQGKNVILMVGSSHVPSLVKEIQNSTIKVNDTIQELENTKKDLPKNIGENKKLSPNSDFDKGR